MRSKVFNTTFENMLRLLLLADTLNTLANVDRLAALDFICIYGKSVRCWIKTFMEIMSSVLLSLQTSAKKITEAVKLSVRNDFIKAEHTEQGFLYSINDRGRQVVQGVQSPYAEAYVVGAKIVCRRFAGYTDESILQYISDKSTEAKEA